MTSSTSSSDPLRPPWSRVWLLAVLVVAGITATWEWLARDAGLGPAYRDNRSLWSDARHRLNDYGSDAVALLGASRIQYAVDVETMSEMLGRPVVQLAVEGTSALTMLENLAADPRFTGTVIYSVAPAFTFNRIHPRIERGKQLEWIRFYSDQSRSERMEQSMRLWLQGELAFRSPDASLQRVLPSLIESGRLPKPEYKRISADRVIRADYSLAPVEIDDLGMVQFYLDNSVPFREPEFAVTLDYVDRLVSILRQKGAEVIFLRLPSSEQVYALESVFYPRAVFWDKMAARLDARFIHADDFPGMAAYVGGDGSHVDSARIVEFTRLLTDVIAARR